MGVFHAMTKKKKSSDGIIKNNLVLYDPYFGDFKSRWMILCECKYAIPSAIWRAQLTNNEGVISFPVLNVSYSCPKGQYSITKQNGRDWVHTPLKIYENIKGNSTTKRLMYVEFTSCV